MQSTPYSTISNGSRSAPRILEFYERKLLPVLFHRLDQAFPEFHWTRMADGWSGAASPTNESTVRREVWCKQPWGFIDGAGHAVSWLEYVGGGCIPANGALLKTIRQLAERAGVDGSALERQYPSEDEQSEVRQHERARSLLEAFVAYCHMKLCDNDGHALRYLLRSHGINGHATGELSLGLYTSPDDVHDYLRSVGFTDTEIATSRVLRDARLPGRIVIPWRDRWGHIRTLVAHDASAQLDGQPRQLYRKCDATNDAFGLDVALRATSGGSDHLILVEGLLDTVFFQLHSVSNVATFGAAGKVPNREQWERLADHGIRQVTLALSDDEAGWQRTVQALVQSYQADRSPQVFAVPTRSLGMARSAATCARLQGVGKFRQAVSERLHGFHYIARHLIRTHRSGEQWTDATLIDLLNAAIDFDASVYTPSRALELERFFWPSILKALDASWESVRRGLRRPLENAQPVVARQETRREFPKRKMPARPAFRPARPKADMHFKKLPVDLQRLAYEIWVRKGRPEGGEQECWLEAEQFVKHHDLQRNTFARSA